MLLLRPAMANAGRRIEVRGTVQGVGFRPWVYRLARDTGVAGRVRNGAGGVVIEAFAPDGALDAFMTRLRQNAPPAASIVELSWRPIPVEEARGFVIDGSQGADERRITIPPDLAVCDACLREIFDPRNRRYRYPFTNCTDCGPRFTILTDLPYDRPSTTMARFTMCEACRREYESPDDRRFHAEPNACPACGPRLALLAGDGARVACADPLAAAAAALRDGAIVAVKGIGGFHLACDATSEAAVQRLRERKRREEKPFAVMVRDLAEAHALAEIDGAEARLLASPERPIVLVPRRAEAALAPSVAPRNPLVGLLLAYTPLHHLLLAEAGRPLVMTSGNRSDEPIAYRDDEAVARLGAIADRLLVHDRPIVAPCDDSVARVAGGSPILLRRARGFVPRPLTVGRPFARPVLAVGAQMKNAVCLGAGDAAYLGPHQGDLDSLETYAGFTASIDRLERLLGVRAEVVAHDLHPDYLSTGYARERAGARAIAVQHHHAHVAAVMGEHNLAGPVIGLAWDGTGLGTDGTAWGGEVLVCDYHQAERVATFRPIPLAGGDRAVREPWRQALAAVDDAFDGTLAVDLLLLFSGIEPRRIATVRRMIAHRLNAPLAHGAGRWFDALGALALARPNAAYEGQIPLEWSARADPVERGRYPVVIDRAVEPWQLDLRPVVWALVADVMCGRTVGVTSARFHNTLVLAAVELARAAASLDGRMPVVLAGGCFQNARLVAGVERALAGAGFVVYRGREVPPGDGGLAFGQALVADAIARRS